MRLIPESTQLRRRYWDGFFGASAATALSKSPTTVRGEDRDFRILSTRDGAFYYLIAAALPDSPPGPGSGGSGGPVLYSQGTWIIKRSVAGGLPVQAKVFLRSDTGSFIRIYPAGDRSMLDLVLYGGVLNREVPLPLPFDQACRSSLADIVSWTAASVEWGLLSPRPGLYSSLRSVVATIRSRLSGLRYADDGAMDEAGRPVLIRNGEPQAGEPGLNCSGFAKWVVDGFYRPLTGMLLDPRAMAARHVDLRGSNLAAAYEEELDPFFGLDWTRNLGLALARARDPATSHQLGDGDVRVSPFALVARPIEAAAVNGGAPYDPYPVYDANRGYAAAGLKSLLYVLALREPGSLYLASISRKGGGEIFGLRRHYHVAVLAPYFEEGGQFTVSVFESDVETGLDALMKRLGGDFVHLVRLPIEGAFEPPSLP